MQVLGGREYGRAHVRADAVALARRWDRRACELDGVSVVLGLPVENIDSLERL
jgi:hypothetical protein